MANSMDSPELRATSPQGPLLILMNPGTISAPVLEPGVLGQRILLCIQGRMWRIVNHQRMAIRRLSLGNTYRLCIPLQIGLSLKEICALTAVNPWVQKRK